MQVIEDRLLLRTRHPEKIVNKIPQSSVVDIEDDIYTICVDWSLPTAQKLARLKMKGVPSPITYEYAWAGVSPPMEHQNTTAEFLTLNPRAFCFNEQGTGKTAAAIWASDYLLDKKHVTRVLIVCPLSIMQSAWQADLFKFAVH